MKTIKQKYCSNCPNCDCEKVITKQALTSIHHTLVEISKETKKTIKQIRDYYQNKIN